MSDLLKVKVGGSNYLCKWEDYHIIGGRRYRTVTIGNQEWLAEDLDYSWTGLHIGSDYWDVEWNAACYYDDDAATYSLSGTKKYGLLYTGVAVKYLDDNKEALLPYGWRVPTATDWNSLITTAGGSSVAGLKLKAVNQSIGGQWPSDWGGTDDYGFAALPCGYYYSAFDDVELRSSYWSLTSSAIMHYDTYVFESNEDEIAVDSDNVNGAHPLRLVRDAT